MSNYQIAQPLDIDHMPAEVATEMLARGRLTARQRKQCVIARQKVFGGAVPLRRQFGTNSIVLFPGGQRLADRKVTRKFYVKPSPWVFDADYVPKTAEEKLARRHSRIPIDRLSRLVTRSIRARRRVQTAYAKLAGDESKQAVKLRRMLDLAATHHEAIQDSAQSTINARMARAANPIL